MQLLGVENRLDEGILEGRTVILLAALAWPGVGVEGASADTSHTHTAFTPAGWDTHLKTGRIAGGGKGRKGKREV